MTNEGGQPAGARVGALSDMELFEDCSDEQIHAIAERLRPLRAAPGEVLMRQGEEAVSFILIQSGRAEIRHTGDDDAVVVDEVCAGVIVGEIALLRDRPAPRPSRPPKRCSAMSETRRRFRLWPTCRESANDWCARRDSDWPRSSRPFRSC